VGHEVPVSTARVGALIAALLIAACQPWYRDAERGGRAVLDSDRTAREFADASAARAAKDPARAAAILRGTVRRNPRVSADVWLALVDAEVAAGDSVTARAHARWELARVNPTEPGAGALRALLIDALARDGRVAAALDLVEPATLDAAVAHPALAAPLRELATGLRQLANPALARVYLGSWLASYGEPDHPILRAARDRIAAALWMSEAGTRDLPAIVADELAAGQLEAALVAYAEARQVVPADSLAALAPTLERAAAAAGITALTPAVHALAIDADAAARRGDLGAAITTYRMVVLRAPWWAAAHRNLDALLAAVRDR
jgi:hypothetical protein